VRFAKKESGGIMSVMPTYQVELARLRPDVLLENPYSWLTPRSYQSYLASRWGGFPIVFYDPGDDIPVNWRQSLLAPAETPIVHHAASIITFNEAGRRRFVSKYGYPASQIHVIPKPVDVASCRYVEPFDDIRREFTAGRADAFVVAYLGRLTEYKGSAVLLDVARRALTDSRMERMRFVFIGGAVASSQTEAQYRLPNTHVTGMIPKAEVPRHLKAADVIAFPDLANPGGFSTAISEAMAAGASIVVGLDGESGCVPLADHDTAIVVPPSDPTALAAALCELRDDDALRRSIARRVGHYAEINMDYRIVARKYLEVMRDAIERTQARRRSRGR
jgi:phosphatidylinositol alpha-mannosyltransferase